MAQKKSNTPAKRQSAPRRMAGKPRTAARRKPRRMNGAKDDGAFFKDGLMGAGGALFAAYAPKLAQKLMKGSTVNPHIVNGVSALAGYGIFKAMPKARALGVGLFIGGVANSAAAVINAIPGMNGVHTSKVARVPQNVRDQINERAAAAMRRMSSGMPQTLTGDPATLTGYAWENLGH